MKSIFNFYKQNRIYISVFLILLILSSIAALSNRNDSTKESLANHEIPEAANADTFIPKGMVLLPIELQNAEALSGILGPLGGLVDLFEPATAKGFEDKKRVPRKLAHRVKLLRAPLNPNLFAVLISEEQSAQLLSYEGPFIAVIQNPETQDVPSQGVPIKGQTSPSTLLREVAPVEVIYGDSGQP